ncbi:cingulin-like protein 1 [Salvelinus namaycush]|uniref:Cingulin-like protein 1 n=1 Tax=Salvelinus namaycush TaxID=8040 RepID=A0A8U0UDI1_SALNM|nr:cingulin-like protein 1 [Salvelinus namaycush]
MESYRVNQPARSSRPHNGAGSYGLSIRVQGIDGHPYVVLNNQDRGSNSYTDPNSNGYNDTQGSFIDNYHEYDFKGSREAVSDSPFVEYRSQKQMQFGGSHNGVTEQGKKPASTLLNFQRHPEILKPYDPEKNTLNLDGNHSLSPRPMSLAETGSTYQGSSPRSTSPVVAHARSSSLDHRSPALQKRTQPQPKPQPQPAPSKPQTKLVQSQSKPQAQLAQPQSKSQTQVAQPQSKPKSQHLSKPQPQSLPQSKPQSPPQSQSPPQPQLPQRVPIPQPYAVSSPTSEQTKASCRSARSISSANSSLNRSHHEPDVLPLRRVDSSGPVLQSSSRSRHSSTSSTDQLEALYADTINRHQNRRYIPFQPGTGRDIDTGSIPGVDELIGKFDGKDGGHQRRGRAGRRNRINPEDRKRSRSVDSALPFSLQGESEYMDEFSKNQGRSTEHVLRPSQLYLQKVSGSKDSWVTAVEGKPSAKATACGSSAPASPQSMTSKAAGSIQGYKAVLNRSSTLPLDSTDAEDGQSSPSTKILTSVATTSLSMPSSNLGKKPSADMDVQVTPDLLKGQQELSQQTHEETAKQILFNYLKDGSTDNEDTTKRKVNLVFEKIQTLKSRAAGSDNKSPDIATQAKALEEQRVALEKDVVELKKQLEEQTKKQMGLTEANEKARAGVKDLQTELERSQEECSRLRDKLAKTEAELRTTLEELFQVKMEREQYQTEIRDLQDQLSEMHDELDGAKTAVADREKDAMMEDLMQMKLDLQEVLLVKEEQEEVLRRRERELTALKGALKAEVATHDQEVDKLREQYEKEIRKLQTSLEKAKQSSAAVGKEKAEVEAAKGAVEGQAGRLSQEAEKLRKRAHELENEVAKLNRIIDDAKLQESKLGDRVGRLEIEKRQLEESLEEIKEQEEEMSRANRALTTRLEDVQRNLTKLNHDHRELEERLKEERSQKEQFKNTKNEIEDERSLLDRTVEKLQREMSEIVEASQSSTQELQEQIDVYKEKNRRELAELQRQLRERGVELDKSCLAAKSLQEELSHVEEDLRQCKRERDDAVLKEKALDQKVYHLEVEAEIKAHSKDDKIRQVKLMEDRINQLELDLDEEKQSGDLLIVRIDRGREQVEQMRNELLQERADRQDLECDKMTLERQNKDLKSRIAHLEGSQKSNKEGLVSQLDSRIQELEERLEGEERDRANLQLVNRKLERKVKEMMMQVDEEHHSLQDQKDQLNLRLKALKRQMDEAEEEIDRLEHGKKKLQRDLDEQQEANEQLQSQLKSLRSEMRRKTNSAPLDDDDEDDISTDGETYFRSSSGYKRSSSQDNIISTFSL